MLRTLLSGLALFGAVALAEKQEVELSEDYGGTIGYLPVNGGWQQFPFGPVNSTTPVMFQLFCPGRLNITDLACSGDRFAIYDNGIFLGDTSVPVFNNCSSNSTDPNYTQKHSNWSHGSFELLPGWHNLSIVPILSPYGAGYGAIRVDSVEGPSPCTVHVCPHHKGNLVVVHTEVPRCQAESVCRSLGMHLAHIDINNFLDATTLAFKCSGPNSQTWIDEWNGDDYRGACLVLSTGSAAPGGAINEPSCCSVRLPVMCQKDPCHHKTVHHSCNDCQKSCFCKERGHCKKCHHGVCHETHSCGLLI